MTPATIIREAQSDGVSLTLSPAGTIKATGDGATANRWLPLIREHKAEIIGLLTDQQEPPGDPPAAEPAPFDSEAWEERAAICEFDGGLSRDEAEAIADAISKHHKGAKAAPPCNSMPKRWCPRFGVQDFGFQKKWFPRWFPKKWLPRKLPRFGIQKAVSKLGIQGNQFLLRFDGRTPSGGGLDRKSG
jgi:hypothetical protein